MAYKIDRYRNSITTTYPHTRKEQEENYKREKAERDYDHKLYNDARSRINTLDDDKKYNGIKILPSLRKRIIRR